VAGGLGSLLLGDGWGRDRFSFEAAAGASHHSTWRMGLGFVWRVGDHDVD
jgi:hypothetical protein